MKVGDVITTKNMKHQGFGPRSSSFTFKAAPDALMVYMYMGNITLDSAPHFNANGVLAALGFGPILATVTQRKLIDALRGSREHLAQLSMDEDNLDDTIAAADAALAAAGNFEKVTETVDPILQDAAMFRALVDKLASAAPPADGINGACALLHKALGSPDIDVQGEDARGAILAVINAALAK